MRKLILGLFLVLLSGCQAPPAPENFGESVAAIRTGLRMTNDTALILVNGGHVSKQRGRDVYEKTVAIRKAVDVANSYDDLSNAEALLEEAKEYLCEQVPDNPNCALLLGAKP